MTPERIAALLEPFLAEAPPPPDGYALLYSQLLCYLELIVKWNEQTNLTSIRNPEEIVRRHFGESLFAARHLGPCATLLDFGSGAGFPGLPIQLLRPDLQVTLAESQGKKSAFLQEVVRTLNLPTAVFPARVESMPPGLRFEAVTLRAVDKMDLAMREASLRASRRLVLLTTEAALPRLLAAAEGFQLSDSHPLPNSSSAIVAILDRR